MPAVLRYVSPVCGITPARPACQLESEHCGLEEEGCWIRPSAQVWGGSTVHGS